MIWPLASMALTPLLLFATLPEGNADRDPNDRQAFHDFLVQAGQTRHPELEQVGIFYRTAWAFWASHSKDYSAHPERYSDVMALYRADQEIYPLRVVLDRWKPERYQEEIDAFRDCDAKNALPEKPALFVGSSSIALWNTADAFPGFSVVNRGFGGSIIGHIQHYYQDVIGKYDPSAILFYCDNDIVLGGDPDQTFAEFKALYLRIRSDFPHVPFVFLGMKASPGDAFAEPTVRSSEERYNSLAEEFAEENPGFRFVDLNTPLLGSDGEVRPDLFRDGVHLNDEGYGIWNGIVQELLVSLHVPQVN